MLQAHMPTKFKTLGSGAPLVAGDNNQVIICDAAERAKLVALRREALEAMNDLILQRRVLRCKRRWVAALGLPDEIASAKLLSN